MECIDQCPPAARRQRDLLPSWLVDDVYDTGGIGYCNITKCCTEVCPEHITITDNGIIPLKERVATERFDPLVHTAGVWISGIATILVYGLAIGLLGRRAYRRRRRAEVVEAAGS